MSTLRHLRLVAFLEGISFLLLVLVAVPLKHYAAMPVGVRVLGPIHGGLFVLFVIALYRAALEHRWTARRSLAAFVASLVPFGTFVLDRSLSAEMERLPIR